MDKSATAAVQPIRQRTQYSCMATSMTMCLKAHGVSTNEDEVNNVMGAVPMRGASWENALACAQHYGFRATLVVPATLKQIKVWTDAGIPVMIAWNPEGREWSHASVVFDVDAEFNVSVADPNIPDPDETVRVVTKDEFYHKWFEKWPNYLVRRPAMAIEREITPEGRQVLASKKANEDWDWKPWAKKVLDWLEINVGSRPTVSAHKRTRADGTTFYQFSFIYPAGRGSSRIMEKWYDRKLLARWKTFTRKWVKDGLAPRYSNSESEFTLPDGTYVEVNGVGYGATPGMSLAASRPGPHWNPLPQQPSEIDGEIEALSFLLKNPRHLQPMLDQPEKPDDRQKTMVAIKALIDALKDQNRMAAKRAAQAVPDSYAQLVSNTVWNFIQTGRTFLAYNMKDHVFRTAVDRAISLLNYRDEKTVAKQLMKDNLLSAEDAFQAVKAAKIIFKDRAERTNRRGAVEHMGKAKTKPVEPPKKDKNKIVVEAPEERNPVEHRRIQDRAKGTGGAGAHKNREKDVERGKAPEKHKKDLRDKEAAVRVASRWLELKDVEDV